MNVMQVSVGNVSYTDILDTMSLVVVTDLLLKSKSLYAAIFTSEADRIYKFCTHISFYKVCVLFISCITFISSVFRTLKIKKYKAVH